MTSRQEAPLAQGVIAVGDCPPHSEAQCVVDRRAVASRLQEELEDDGVRCGPVAGAEVSRVEIFMLYGHLCRGEAIGPGCLFKLD
mgnify:CR=1 FL=1